PAERGEGVCRPPTRRHTLSRFRVTSSRPLFRSADASSGRMQAGPRRRETHPPRPAGGGGGGGGGGAAAGGDDACRSANRRASPRVFLDVFPDETSPQRR